MYQRLDPPIGAHLYSLTRLMPPTPEATGQRADTPVSGKLTAFAIMTTDNEIFASALKTPPSTISEMDGTGRCQLQALGLTALDGGTRADWPRIMRRGCLRTGSHKWIPKSCRQ